MTDALHSCRAAVALNNMGVTLLERGCCRDAMKNFRDGLSLMMNEGVDPHDSKESLRRSSQRIVASSSDSSAKTTVNFELTALSHDDTSTTCAMTVAIHEFQSSSVGFVMRLDWNEDEQDMADAGAYYKATLLYNYAVACRMHAVTCSKSSSKAQKLQTLATKAALSAHATLTNVVSERSLTLLMLDVQQLMQLATAEGDKDKACKYYCELAFIRTQLEDYHHEVSVIFKRRDRTAAAA